MPRLPASAALLLTVPLLALTACSGSGSDSGAGLGLGLGPDRAAPSASASPSASPSASAPPTPSASAPAPGTAPVPTGAASRPCTPIAALDAAGLGAYIKALRASDRTTSSYSALFMVDTGVYLRLKDAQRPCEPIRVRLSHFRVHIAKATPGSSTGGFSFTYTPLETLTVSAGPGDGFAEGSKPPATEKCGGTLSVSYLGDEVTARELPSQLQFPKTDSTLDWTLADVSADRVLDAVFKPPADAGSC
ncbi:hypothetical protein ACFWAR_15895 [Streptomyces sp. NPDC059917]|uniref:hypothetical protein n=1 Tax=Streptomyces sp. NPDC059917 TaxID=3347002 RepID=UPI00364D030F